MNQQKVKVFTRTVLLDLFVAFMGACSALSYTVFIFPNQFAPAGINGIATMIQEKLGFEVSYLSLIINLPLCIFAFVKLNRTFARRTMEYVVAFSLFLMLFRDWAFLKDFVYHEDYSRLLAPVAAGIITGAIYGTLLRVGGSTGGTDVVGALIHHAKPQYSTVWIIFVINACVAFSSYFVYGYKLEPVLLCILYSFMSTSVSEAIIRGRKSAMKFEIITSHADEIAEAIMTQMHHGCTLLEGKGAYSHADKTVLICVIQKEQVPQMMNILHHFPNTFAYVSQVSETVGNFVHVREKVKIKMEYTDENPML